MEVLIAVILILAVIIAIAKIIATHWKPVFGALAVLLVIGGTINHFAPEKPTQAVALASTTTPAAPAIQETDEDKRLRQVGEQAKQEQAAAVARADAERKRYITGFTDETPPKDPNDKMRNGANVKRFANSDANSEFWYMIDAKANKATGRVVTLIYSAPSKTCKGWSYLENKPSCFEFPEFWRRDEIDCKTGQSRLIGEYMKLREVQAPFTASKRFEPIGEYKVQRTVRGMVCQ